MGLEQRPGQQHTPESQAPIHVRMGEPFAPFEPSRMPDLSVARFVFERPLTLEGVGVGYIRIVDITPNLEELDFVSNVPKVLQSYDAPYGALHFICFSSPEFPEGERYTLFPLALQEIRLSLNRPKEEVAPPVVRVEFQGTAYRYWSVDVFGDPADRGWYNSNEAAYWDWCWEQTGEYRSVGFNREVDQVKGIHVTFFPKEAFPQVVSDQPPLRKPQHRKLGAECWGDIEDHPLFRDGVLYVYNFR